MGPCPAPALEASTPPLSALAGQVQTLGPAVRTPVAPCCHQWDAEGVLVCSRSHRGGGADTRAGKGRILELCVRFKSCEMESCFCILLAL